MALTCPARPPARREAPPGARRPGRGCPPLPASRRARAAPLGPGRAGHRDEATHLYTHRRAASSPADRPLARGRAHSPRGPARGRREGRSGGPVCQRHVNHERPEAAGLSRTCDRRKWLSWPRRPRGAASRRTLVAPYKQEVAGSNPAPPIKRKPCKPAAVEILLRSRALLLGVVEGHRGDRRRGDGAALDRDLDALTVAREIGAQHRQADDLAESRALARARQRADRLAVLRDGRAVPGNRVRRRRA